MDSWSSPGKPPDPFTLPSETDAHFTLLIVSVVGSSILLYSILFNQIPAFWDTSQSEIQRCSAVVAAAIPGTDILLQGQRIEQQAACERPIRLAQSAWELGGAALLVGVALGLYWWLPRHTLRRSGFRPLGRTQDAELVACVDELASEIGLNVVPNIVCNPLHRSGGGVAFGRWGQRYLGLYGGTLLRFRRQPEMFRSVVLHELAHLRHADIDKATLAVTVWWAFLLVAVAPAAVGTLLAGLFQPDRAFGLSWRLVVVAALVALTRAAVLRERELYADQRAWHLGAPGLVAALEKLTEPPVLARLRVPDFVRRGLALHPPVADRLHALHDPALLFRFSPWTAFAAGMVTTLALESIGQVVYGFASGLANAVVAALALGLPLAGALTLSMWRDEWYQLRLGHSAPVRSTLGLGLALGLGLVVGWHSSLVFYAYDFSGSRLTGVPAVVFELGFAGLCLLSMAAFIAWLRTGARAWLPHVGRRRRSARLGLTGAVAAATVLLAAVLAYLSWGVTSTMTGLRAFDRVSLAPLAEMGLPTDLSPEMSVLVLGFGISLMQITWVPQLPPIIALLWAYPLAAGLLPGAHEQRPRWRLVGVVSLVMGLVTVPPFFVLTLAFFDTSNVLAFALAGPLVFGLFQFAAALLVRFRVRDFAVVHALAAAQLTGLVAVAVLIGLSGFPAEWNAIGSIASAGLLVAAVLLLLLEPVIVLVRREPRPHVPAAADAVSGSG